MWDAAYKNSLLKKRSLSKPSEENGRAAGQHKRGKMTAKERIDELLDKDSFVEIAALAQTRSDNFSLSEKKMLGDGVITGYGTIHGRVVCVSSDDFTSIGGSLGECHAEKVCRVMDLALEMGVPFISIHDSGGARIEEGIASLNGYAEIFLRNTKASGIIPQIAVIMGPCAGGACYSPALCDYIFAVDNTSQMYITGPQVVQTVTGETVDAEALGGTGVLTGTSGVAHFSYPDDRTCLEGVRKFMTYLPENCREAPPETAPHPAETPESLEEIVPQKQRRGYDVRRVIRSIADEDSFFEIQERFAPNLVIGFLRMDGQVIGVVANQPSYLAGSLDINASDKAARFVRFCDCFNIPILSLVDVPGYLPGTQQEYGGIIRHGAKLLYAFSESRVPKISLIMRKAYGGAYIAMNSKGIGADYVFAWPIAQVAVMGAEGAVKIIFKKQIQNAEDPKAEEKKLVEEYENAFMNPYCAADRLFVDEVILPEETRDCLIKAFRFCKNKSVKTHGKKHGNIPL